MLQLLGDFRASKGLGLRVVFSKGSILPGASKHSSGNFGASKGSAHDDARRVLSESWY